MKRRALNYTQDFREFMIKGEKRNFLSFYRDLYDIVRYIMEIIIKNIMRKFIKDYNGKHKI